MIRKMMLMTLLGTFLITAYACGNDDSSGSDDAAQEIKYQKSLERVNLFESDMPSDFKLIDYRQKAEDFDRFLFDYDLEGPYLPLIWEDDVNDSYGFGAYVGDNRPHEAGSQEGVSLISAVLSASLNGIDKQDQHNQNFVKQLNAFYNESESVVLNGTNASSTDTSLWYSLYPAILYTQVSILHEDETLMRDNALATIDSWYEAHNVMYDSGNGSYEYTKFDFTTMEPSFNGVWKEPDSAAGVGMLMYYGYTLTGEAKYLEALKETMDYIEAYDGSPLYELLLYYAPFLSGYLNAEHGTDYDVGNTIHEIFSGRSIPRGGWGMITDSFGDYPMSGTMGSTTDRDGYAFSMNTFAAAYTIPNVLKYDTRYASDIGKWLVHLTSNSRYYFPDQSEADHQSCTETMCKNFIDITNASFPYEGIINGHNSKTPWIGGDPLITGWAETDMSVYSGAATGLLSSVLEETDVEGILKFDVSSLELNQGPYKTYLVYNPHDESKTFTYNSTSSSSVDLFDGVSATKVATEVEDTVSLSLEAKESMIITEIPEGETISLDDNRYVDESGHVITKLHVSTGLESHGNGATLTDSSTLRVGHASPLENDAIKHITVTVNNQEFSVEDSNTITIDTSKLYADGSRRFTFEIEMESGLKDSFSQILKIEKDS